MDFASAFPAQVTWNMMRGLPSTPGEAGRGWSGGLMSLFIPQTGKAWLAALARGFCCSIVGNRKKVLAVQCQNRKQLAILPATVLKLRSLLRTGKE